VNHVNAKDIVPEGQKMVVTANRRHRMIRRIKQRKEISVPEKLHINGRAHSRLELGRDALVSMPALNASSSSSSSVSGFGRLRTGLVDEDLPTRLEFGCTMTVRMDGLDEPVPGDGRALLTEPGETREADGRVVSDTGVTAKRAV
jgi:hypothetical protein